MDQAQRSEALGGTSPPALSDAIEKIMAHPELISMVASVLGKSGEQKEGEQVPPASKEGLGDVADTAEPLVSSEAAPTSVQSSPQALPKELPELVSTLAPLLSGMGKGGGSPAKGAPSSNSACLLRALKPYVSHGRREAIDYMIRISEFSEILKHLR